ncbi:hypothetical protein LIN78_00855 [Leeia sp. TBRC 13508]|uniref:Uncharacterized protein n=1 Tax=Leeia speluncae TaxID=2884804 RepID=A0ABS8D1P3_9NEIS|nr:hypothetical protein [Leeia speluncae]MCB6182105.1 hypothetical protein [Leeia speluncae]
MNNDTDFRRDEALVSSAYHQIELPSPPNALDEKILLAVNTELQKNRLIPPRNKLPSLIGSLSIAASLVLAVGVGLMLKMNQANEAAVLMPEEVQAIKDAEARKQQEEAAKHAKARLAKPQSIANADFAEASPQAEQSPVPPSKEASQGAPTADELNKVANPSTMQMEPRLAKVPPPSASTPSVVAKAVVPSPVSESAVVTADAATPKETKVDNRSAAASAAVLADKAPVDKPQAANASDAAKKMAAKNEVVPAIEAAPVAAAAPAPTVVAKEVAKPKMEIKAKTATEWLSEIRQLKRNGQEKKADQELGRFKAFYPEESIPADLQ